MRARTRRQYAAGSWYGRQLRWKVPHAQRGQQLTAAYLNLVVDAVNGVLVPPRDLTEGVIDDGNRLRYAPIDGVVAYEGRVENPEDEEQYAIVENTTQIVVRITPEMIPIQAGDLWIMSRNEDGSPSDPDTFDTVKEAWSVVNGKVTPVTY